MKTRKGQVAWLSVNTQRVFKTYEAAQKDASFYLTFYKKIDEKNANILSHDYIKVVNLWLNK